MPSKTQTRLQITAKNALRRAKRLSKLSASWITFHNAMFGMGGELFELFPTRSERVAFCKTPEYSQILDMLANIRDHNREPSKNVSDTTATARGSLTIRVPKSIHAALLLEAQSEDVSLNQLCLAKLAVQLRGVIMNRYTATED